MSSFAESQKNTNPEPYDQIFVLSQATINAFFNELWNRTPGLKHVQRPPGTSVQQLDADLGPPVISIPVEAPNLFGQIYLHLKLQSGTLRLRDGAGVLQTFNVANWDIVLRTKIKEKLISDTDPIYNAYRSQAGFRDSIFSLKQLYLDCSDFGEDAFFDERKSYLGTAPIPPGTMANLRKFMWDWQRDANFYQRNILGYSLIHTRSAGDSAIGTFAPTSISYWPYPWKDPSRPTVPTDDMPQNALCLLTMARFREPPLSRGLTYSGTFVNTGAAFCMNSRLFWDDWLLHLIKPVNAATQMIPAKVNLGRWGHLNLKPKYQFGSSRNPDDSYFNWTRSSDANGSGSWTWKGETLKTKSSVAVPTDKSVQLGCTQAATSSTHVSAHPGDSTISIQGKHIFDFNIYVQIPNAGNAIKLTTDWHLDFRAEAVNDGGIQIAFVSSGSKTTHTQKITHKGWQHDKNIQNWYKPIQSWHDRYFATNIASLRNRLSSDLRSHQNLFIPGSGAYQMNNPKFNKRGDLLVDLNYLTAAQASATGRFVVDSSVGNIVNDGDGDGGFNNDDQFDLGVQQGLPSRQALETEETSHITIDDHEFPVSHVDVDAILGGHGGEDDYGEHNPDESTDNGPAGNYGGYVPPPPQL